MPTSHYKVGLLSSSLSQTAGGIYDVVKAHYLTLSQHGIEVVAIGAHDDKYIQSEWPNHPPLIYRKMDSHFGYSGELKKILNSNRFNLLHLHGLWMYNQWIGSSFSRQKNVPLIISPHGMLDPWAVKNSAWKKKLVGALFANRSLRQANCIHALCQSEYESIRAYGLKNPVAIIPNGIDLPKNFNKEYHKSTKTLLFIGRIHPKKGLMNLMNALAIIKNIKPDFFTSWKIKIAGWDQVGHLEELRELCKKHELTYVVNFVGPLFGNEKEAALKTADAFILPSYSEGLPMSVLEAWAYQLPVIMTKECNLPEGFKSGAALEIALDPKDIANKLMELDSWSPKQFETMGTKAYNLVSRKFTWEKIAKDMAETYDWLLNKKPPPEFVRFD